jgi:hypothetical protein
MGPSESGFPPTLRHVVGWLMLAVGLSVFPIRLQHAGPYAFPRGGNLLAGVLALLLGGWLARPWLGSHRLAAPLGWLALAASPVVLFFALYATLDELEELVVLKAADRAAQPVNLRLWIVDRADAARVTMPRWKAEAHGLSEARVELPRQGEASCVIATRHEDRAAVNEIHRLRHEKYGLQRFATALGLFDRPPGEDTVAPRLDRCPRL